MKRFVPLIAALAFLLPASQADGAAQQIMSCGEASNGWYLWRGAGVPGVPNTKCSFVRATYRKVWRKTKKEGALPNQFRVKVRGHRLTCQIQKPRRDFITCRSKKRWVGLEGEFDFRSLSDSAAQQEADLRRTKRCGVFPGNGAYSYIKAQGVTCRQARRVSNRARRKFCQQTGVCQSVEPTKKRYRGRVKTNGWKCSVVLGYEFSRIICRKKDILFRAESAA